MHMQQYQLVNGQAQWGHVAQRAHRGFSLIEIMIATALGSLILLLAIMAVRTSTDALRSLERQSQVNDALRIGWMALVDDIDHWRSHGDPGYPYGREFARAEEGANKELFRKVAWDNPRVRGGMIDPSGPGAYIIHAPLPGVAGQVVARAPMSGRLSDLTVFREEDFNDPKYEGFSSWRLFQMIWEGGDPLTNVRLRLHDFVAEDPMENPDSPFYYDVEQHRQATGGPGQDTAYVLNVSYTLPQGWNPWNIIGDYPSLANYERILPDILPASTPHVQAVQAHAFTHLGHHGVASYAPPGAGNMIADPATRAVPGSLEVSIEDPFTRNELGDYVKGMPGSAIGIRTPPVAPHWETIGNRGRWDGQNRVKQYRLASSTVGLIAGTADGWSAGNSGLWISTTPASNLWSSMFKLGLIDYDRATGMAPGHLQFAAAPQGFIYGARPGDEDWYADPQRRLFSDQVVNDDGTNPRSIRSDEFYESRNLYAGRSIGGMLRPHIIWTDHLPTAPTDSVLRPEHLEGDSISLRTGVVRWRHNGRDKNTGWVRVSEGSNQEISMAIPLLSSSWRGARLQWERDE